MPCQLGYTVFCVLFLGFLGWVLSLIVLAPWYFSIKWSEKYAFEKIVMIGFPSVGVVLGLITGAEGVDEGPSRGFGSTERSEGQQSSPGVSESAQRPKSPEVRNQPTRTVMMRPLQGTIPRHSHPTLM